MHFGWIKTGVMFWLLSRPRGEIKARHFVLALAPTCSRPRWKCAWLSSDEAPLNFIIPKVQRGFFFFFPPSFYKQLWEQTFYDLSLDLYVLKDEGKHDTAKGFDYNSVRRQQCWTILPSGRNRSKPKVYKRGWSASWWTTACKNL